MSISTKNWGKPLQRSLGALILTALALFALASRPVLAAGTTLAPGDLVFTGYVTNGNPVDLFSFVTLVPLEAQTVIYFTDNGWDGTGFRTVTDISGTGKESVMRLTINATVAAGTIIRSNDTSPNFTWDSSSAIPAGSKYSTLGLGQGGDQIAAVQSTNTNNPLFSGFTPISQIDYTGAFEPAIDNSTGALLPGLSQATGSAILFNNLSTFAAFKVDALASGTPTAWRTAIANPSNWTFNTTGQALPTGSLTIMTPATITTQPTSQGVISGTTTTLSVEAGGTGPFSYQWYQGATGDVSNPIAGATAASFTTPILTAPATDSYWVRVSNGAGSVDSATVTVTAIDPATLTNKLYLPLVTK